MIDLYLGAIPGQAKKTHCMLPLSAFLSHFICHCCILARRTRSSVLRFSSSTPSKKCMFAPMTSSAKSTHTIPKPLTQFKPPASEMRGNATKTIASAISVYEPCFHFLKEPNRIPSSPCDSMYLVYERTGRNMRQTYRDEPYKS